MMTSADNEAKALRRGAARLFLAADLRDIARAVCNLSVTAKTISLWAVCFAHLLGRHGAWSGAHWNQTDWHGKIRGRSPGLPAHVIGAPSRRQEMKMFQPLAAPLKGLT